MTTASASANAVRIGPVGVPKYTLGWDILRWTALYLLQPDGPKAGAPWNFTDEQARFILWWYATDDRGEFIYRSGMLRRMKGWGKDPVGATICAIEFVGPCRVVGWKDGQPVGGPVHSSWVQTAAVSKEQTRNTMTLFPGMFSKRAIAEYEIDMGKELIYAHHGRCQIQAVTSSPSTLEGARSSFVLKNETHHWLNNNEGHEMAAVIRRNTAKIQGRVLAISNAHNPGEDSDAEKDWDTYQQIAQGRSRASGFLYDSIEAAPDTDLYDPESLRNGLMAARGDSYWVPVDRLVEEIYDPRTPPSTSRRFYLNQIVAAEDAWIAPHQWDALRQPDYTVKPKSLVVLGFDGSKSDDWTALVGCEVKTGFIWPLGIWDPAQYGGEVPRELVDAAVQRAFAVYDVVGFYSDLSPFESYVDKWNEEHWKTLCTKASAKNRVAWDMRARQREITFAAEAFNDAIVEGAFTHDGDPTLAQHVYNARRRPNNHGVTFGKEHRESARKVDGLSAALLAHRCRKDYVALPKSQQRRQKTGRAQFA